MSAVSESERVLPRSFRATQDGPRTYEWACVALAFSLMAVASLAALRSLGTPVPSCFFDPYGELSAVYVPGWGAERWRVAAATRLRAIDGVALTAERPADRADEIFDRVASAYAAGRTTVDLELGSDDARRAPIRTLGGTTVALFFGAYAIMGGCLLWSGLLVLRVAGRREGARAYAIACGVGFVFLVTFYDYHTTRWLAPLFGASTFGIPTSLLSLAIHFPDPPPAHALARRLGRACLVIACGVCGALAIAPFVHADVRPLRMLTNIAVPASLIVLAGTMLVRWRRAHGRARHELRAASVGLVAAPVMAGVGLAYTAIAGSVAFHVLLPALGFVVPAAIGRAYVRHNILVSGRVLTPRMALVPALTLGIVAAQLSFVLAYELVDRREQGPWVVAVAIALLTGGAVAWTTRRRLLAWMFPARRAFRPVVGDLTSMLAHVRTREEAAGVLKQIVSRWLPTERVEVVIGSSLPRSLATHLSVLSLDGASWTDEAADVRRLVVPMQTTDRPTGSIVVSPKHGGAPFGVDDVILLETIAAIGALAIRHVDSQVELATLSAVETDTSRSDRRLAFDVVGAELAHEIAYPLAFFRHLVDTLARGETIPADDVDIGREEIARLERMLGAARAWQVRAPSLAMVRLRAVADRTAMLLRGAFTRTTLEVVVPADLSVRADEDILLQLLANLLRNAAEAAGPKGMVSLTAREGSDVIIEVRDDGPGLSEEAKLRLSTPFSTSKTHGTGLGLAVARRIVATLGWRLEALREDGWTVFRIHARRASEQLEGERA